MDNNSPELGLALSFIQEHPGTAARELELHTAESAAELIEELPLDSGRQLFLSLLPGYAARVCLLLPADEVSALLNNANINQITSIFRCIPKSRRSSLFRALPDKSSALCRLLLSYSQDTVGAWMIADIIMLPATCAAAEVITRIELSDSAADTNTLPVVNQRQHLLGLVNIRDVLNAQQETVVTDLMKKPAAMLQSRSRLAAGANHQGWQQNDSLPVLNRNRQLVGILRYADLRRAISDSDNIETIADSQKGEWLGGFAQMYVRTLSALLDLVTKTPSQSGSQANRS